MFCYIVGACLLWSSVSDLVSHNIVISSTWISLYYMFRKPVGVFTFIV